MRPFIARGASFGVVAGSKGDELPDQKGNSVGVERF
jgi:hypothetical protein